MIQLVEVVEATIPTRQNERFHLREIYISPEHVIMVREDRGTEQTIRESANKYPDIPQGMKFTKLTINRGTTGHDIVVLGSADMIFEKIESAKIRAKQLLRG